MMRAALQWRLLLLWAACLLAPTLLITLPLLRILGLSMDHSVSAAALAQELDLSTLADLLANFRRAGATFPIAVMEALILTLLLSPLLSGMAMSAARAGKPQGFGTLFMGGLHEYWRMARMLALAVIPLGLAAVLGAAAMSEAAKHNRTLVLEAEADSVRLLAMLVAFLLLVLAHATIDAGRAALALDRRRNSVLMAWLDGCKLLLRRPLATLGAYLAITLAGLAVAAALSLARIHLPQAGVAGFIGAFVLTQLIVMAFGWMRTARLFALVEVARPLYSPLN